jgi:hypothetical protein
MNILLFSLLVTGVWDLSLDMGLNLSQSYYNDAWEGDETGTITWTAITNFDAIKRLSPKLLFSNSSKFAFGQTHSQNGETKRWNPPVKSTDKIDNETILRWTVGWVVDPFISLRFLSQFFDNSDTLFLNPINITESFGLARPIFKNTKMLITRLGIAFKENFDRKGRQKVQVEGGVEWLTTGKISFSEKILYEGKLRVFKSIYNSKAKEFPNQNWKTPDVDFENTVSVSLGKFLQLTFYLEIIYDRERNETVQIKENVAFGLSYKIL